MSSRANGLKTAFAYSSGHVGLGNVAAIAEVQFRALNEAGTDGTRMTVLYSAGANKGRQERHRGCSCLTRNASCSHAVDKMVCQGVDVGPTSAFTDILGAGTNTEMHPAPLAAVIRPVLSGLPFAFLRSAS
jgi:hypothetical protein